MCVCKQNAQSAVIVCLSFYIVKRHTYALLKVLDLKLAILFTIHVIQAFEWTTAQGTVPYKSNISRIILEATLRTSYCLNFLTESPNIPTRCNTPIWHASFWAPRCHLHCWHRPKSSPSDPWPTLLSSTQRIPLRTLVTSSNFISWPTTEASSWEIWTSLANRQPLEDSTRASSLRTTRQART